MCVSYKHIHTCKVHYVFVYLFSICIPLNINFSVGFFVFVSVLIDEASNHIIPDSACCCDINIRGNFKNAQSAL